MFEAESKPTEEISSWWIGRWAHVIAGIFFCVLYFSLSGFAWSWQVAVTLAYVVFVFCCACGLSFQDSDDFFGDPKVPEYVANLLGRQFVILALVSLGAYEWHHLISVLPNWAKTRTFRNLSLWEVGGVVVAYRVAINEAKWMAAKLKQRFPELKEPMNLIRSKETSVD